MALAPVLRSVEFLLGINFDARRALYFQNEKILAIADLHLGYAWSHRAQGQLMPIGKDDALARFEQLLNDYQPKQVILLGDIVHRALPVPALLDELSALFNLAENKTELILLAGNHDRQLQKILKNLNRAEALQTEFTAGQNVFLHGDRPATQPAARYIIGHEHPAISLGDGVATSRKFPCFLISEQVITLPSFSSWSAHTPLNAYEFMSPLARNAKFKTALAILGDRLLPVPINRS